MVPSSHIRWLTTSCNPSSWGSNVLLWLLQATTLMQTDMHTYDFFKKEKERGGERREERRAWQGEQGKRKKGRKGRRTFN